MKLLLTSNGLSNDSIAQAFAELVGKDFKDIKVAFVPTAAQAERSDKNWLIHDLYRIKERGCYVDIIELTAVQGEVLRAALDDMDVIFVGGGNTFYLSYWLHRSGLADMLPDLLQTKVYAGISAGSIVTGAGLNLTSQALEHPQAFQDEDYDLLGPKGQASGASLHLVDFFFRPHLNSRHFSLVRKDLLEAKAKELDSPVYALDDNSALKIIDGHIDVVSEGDWLLLNGRNG